MSANGSESGRRRGAAGYVAGTWVVGTSTWPVENPASCELIGNVSYGDRAMARAAMDAAKDAFPAWAGRTARERADILIAVASEVLRSADTGAKLLSAETGKARALALGEFRSAAEWLRWYAEECRRPVGSIAPNERYGRRHVLLRQPAGVVVCLTAWNYPVSGLIRKLAPALAAGCTVVFTIGRRETVRVG